MPSVGKLNNRLSDIADLENSLWKSFQKTEKEYLPSMSNPFKCMRDVINLNQEKLLPYRYNYPVYLAFSLLSTFGVLLISFWFLVPYTVFYIAAMHSRSKFVEAFAKHKLANSNFVNYAFGINQPSLIVAGMIKLREAGGGKITQDTLQSILKILKASNDYSDVSIGIAEALKKFLFGVPFLFIVWIYQNSVTFNNYTSKIRDFVLSNWIAGFFLISFSLLLLYICYDLILGQTLHKRTKKKYFLALTLLAENFKER